MANTLRFKRGLVSGIPTAVAGEPLFTTDTFDLYIGNGTTNTRFQKYIASGSSTQLIRGDGSLLTMPIVLTSPTNGQVLKYNGTNWVNDSDAGVTGSGATGQVAYWTGTSSQAGNNNLFWDAANSRLGIRSSSPTGNLEIKTANDLATLRAYPNDDFSSPLHLLRGNNGVVSINTFTNNGTITAPTDVSASGTITRFTGNIYLDGAYRNVARMEYITTSIPAIGNPPTAIRWLTTNASYSLDERMRITAGGNLLVGTTTDGSQRLQVMGDAFIKGSGIGSATALAIQNNSGLHLLRVQNNGMLRLGSTSSSPFIFPITIVASVEDLLGTNLSFYSYTGSQSASSGRFIFGGENMVQTTGANFNIYSRSQFFPTSGTATLADIYINPQISQTGGANGITRGLHVQPTLTAAADWRSIEWSNNSGWGLYGAGTADNYLRGKLLINTTTVGTFDLDVNGTARVSGAATFSSSVTASSFIKSGGTSSQYLMADGSVTTGGGGGVDELQVALLSQVYG